MSIPPLDIPTDTHTWFKIFLSGDTPSAFLLSHLFLMPREQMALREDHTVTGQIALRVPILSLWVPFLSLWAPF